MERCAVFDNVLPAVLARALPLISQAFAHGFHAELDFVPRRGIHARGLDGDGEAGILRIRRLIRRRFTVFPLRFLFIRGGERLGNGRAGRFRRDFSGRLFGRFGGSFRQGRVRRFRRGFRDRLLCRFRHGNHGDQVKFAQIGEGERRLVLAEIYIQLHFPGPVRHVWFLRQIAKQEQGNRPVGILLPEGGKTEAFHPHIRFPVQRRPGQTENRMADLGRVGVFQTETFYGTGFESVIAFFFIVSVNFNLGSGIGHALRRGNDEDDSINICFLIKGSGRSSRGFLHRLGCRFPGRFFGWFPSRFFGWFHCRFCCRLRGRFSGRLGCGFCRWFRRRLCCGFRRGFCRRLRRRLYCRFFGRFRCRFGRRLHSGFCCGFRGRLGCGFCRGFSCRLHSGFHAGFSGRLCRRLRGRFLSGVNRRLLLRKFLERRV